MAFGNSSIISSSKGLYEVIDDSWKKLETPPVARFVIEANDQDYFIYDKAVYRRKISRIAKIIGSEDLLNSSIASACSDQKGKLIFLLQNGVLLSWDAHQKMSYVQQPFFSTKNIFYSDYLFALSNEDDLYYLNDKKQWTLVGQDVDVSAFENDMNSNIWLNDAIELKLLRPTIFENIKTNYIFNNTPVQSLAMDCTGSLLMAWDNKGVFMMDADENIHQAAWAKELSNKRVTAIASDQNCHLWIGTAGYGVFYYDGFNLTALSKDKEIAGDFISDIEVDNDGNIWIGTRDAGIKIIGADSTGFNLINPLDNQLQNEKLITDLVKDPKGRIWVGTSNSGVHCFNKFELQYHYATAKPGEYNPVLKLAPWNAKGICIATRQKEVHFLNTSDQAGAFTVVPVAEAVQSFLKNQAGELFAYNGSQLGEWVQEDDAYSIKDRGINSSGFQIYDYQINREDGTVYIATNNGLKKWSGALANKINRPKSSVSMTDVQLNYKSLENFKTNHKRFSHIENNFGFAFQSKSLYPSSIKYQWKLDDTDADWSPSSDQTNVNYSALPPGNYTFRVRTADLMSEDQFTFRIKSAWWQNRLLQILLAIALVSFLIASIRNYYKRKQLKEKQLYEKLTMENQVLSLKQQALQLQMNPHFIFNALTSIQNLVGKEDPKKARFYLAKFSRLMRNILEHSREDFITLEEEMKLLDDYLSVEKLVHNDSFDFSIKVDPNVDPSINIAPMMIQPFVENAVKHGASKVENGKVEIDFQLKGKNISCTIKDNGPGFIARSNQEHKSISMEVISERLALLQKNAKNHVQINSAKEGSNIQITLPIM